MSDIEEVWNNGPRWLEHMRCMESEGDREYREMTERGLVLVRGNWLTRETAAEVLVELEAA